MRVPPMLSHLLALLRINLATIIAKPWQTVLGATMMFANNLVFFMIWVIYFNNFSSIRGWERGDIALLIGVVAWAFGLNSLLIIGARDLAQTIVDGGLDLHLGRPRHPLPGLLLSRSAPGGIGDLATAVLYWLWLAGRPPGELPLLLAVSTAAAVVLAATTTLFQCIVFWLPKALPLCEDLFQTFLMVAFYPEHPFGFRVRLLLFTVFPAGFVAFLPAQAVRDADPLQVLALFAAAIVYAGLAVAIFNRGLRRYASGNRVLELR